MNYYEIDFPFDEAENYFQSSNKMKLNHFFYKGEVYDKLRKESTYYLVGDKGSGKTAYSAYFCNNIIEGNIKSKSYPIAVDDYNKIIQMKKEGKLDYTHYVTLWKAIILIKLCASLEVNEVNFFGRNGFKKIEALLQKYKFTSFSLDTFSPVSFMDSAEFSNSCSINVGLDGLKPSISQYRKNANQASSQKNIYNDNWVTFINEMSEEISHIKLNNSHYLFIDGIDSRPSDIDFKSYSECVYPLIRAVYEVNSSILSRVKDRSKGRLQVVLLTRLDIFLQSGLSNPGSKLNDNCAYIDWNTSENNFETSSIYEVVNNMLSQKNNNVNWKSYFNFLIKRGDRYFDSFVYFLRLTTGKPRDFVRVLSIIKTLCDSGTPNPSAELIESDDFQKAYSMYFIDKIRTSLSFTYSSSEIEELFGFLRTIGKKSIRKSELQHLYDNYPQKSILDNSFNGFFGVVKVLFDNDMLCYSEGNGVYRWKYKEISIASYNYNIPIESLPNKTTFIFNWALEKGFSMYVKMQRSVN